MTQENSDHKSAEKEKFSEALKDEEADEEEDEALAIALSMSRGDHNTSLLPAAGALVAAADSPWLDANPLGREQLQRQMLQQEQTELQRAAAGLVELLKQRCQTLKGVLRSAFCVIV
jgi:hypothetical protein